MIETRLENFDSSVFDKEASKIKILTWFFVNALIVKHHGIHL